MTMRYFHLMTILLVLTLAGGIVVSTNPASAVTAAEIDGDTKKTLDILYAKSPKAMELGEKAKGVLVFPGIVKGGFMSVGQYGEGALLKGGKTAGYYSTVQLSYGWAGIQKFGYALFLMTDSAMGWINKSDGWELGTGPSIVVMDIGAAKSFSTTTLQSEAYAFFFDQKGLMGGIGLQGTKITKIKR